MSRESFLARVRQAAAAGRSYRVHTRSEVTPEMGYADRSGDLRQQYVAEVAKAGGKAVLVESHEKARFAIVDIFKLYEPRSALCWSHPVLCRLKLATLLQEQRIEMIDSAALAELDFDARRGKLLGADIGITSAACAVAETGSLVMAHRFGNERVASLLPPVYIAVVESSQIVADLFDVFAPGGLFDPQDLPSNITFITGPSKTGDIESKLVTGVHGPGKWHVIVIDEPAVV